MDVIHRVNYVSTLFDEGYLFSECRLAGIQGGSKRADQDTELDLAAGLR
jgi:hypothetical protein